MSTQPHMVADLSITPLSLEPPGRILAQSGDIDNRLKTLLDALKLPRQPDDLNGMAPSKDESPFFCLAEDDDLKLNIKTDRRLDPAAKLSDVVLL